MEARKQFKYCIVGLGAHAINKIVPAIEQSGNSLCAVVTSQNPSPITAVPSFGTLHDAVDVLPRECIYILSSPPAIHFEQARLLASNGLDVIIEKPAFLTFRDAKEVAELASSQGGSVIEGFMHRYSDTYATAVSCFSENTEKIVGIKSSFTVPQLPSNTFRSDAEIHSSVLYDIGCYIVSFCVDVELEDLALSVVKYVYREQDNHEHVVLKGLGSGMQLDFDFGVADEYCNELTLFFDNGNYSKFAPFYFGRPGSRSYQQFHGKEIVEYQIVETNTFANMLSTNFKPSGQLIRSTNIVSIAAQLEGLAKEIEQRRLKNLM